MGDDAEFQMEFEKYGAWWENGDTTEPLTITAEPFYFSQEDARRWDNEHANRANFVEAIVAAHFVKRGYHVLRDFCTTNRDVQPVGSLKSHSTQLLHDVVGEEVSHFLCSDLAADNPLGYGEPDLFVFREDRPDPKLMYSDPRLWFFVEVKGPKDTVRDNQTAYWRALADGSGENRLILARVAPAGTTPALDHIEY